MRLIPTFLRTFIVLGIVAGLTSAIAAFVAKGRLASSGSAEDAEVDLVAIYDASNFASTSPAFRRATVTAWYGGGTLDLRAATLDPAGARLTIRALFGGYRVVLPETWRVELELTAILGGVGDTRNADLANPDGPLLVIDGMAVFGGIGIVSNAPDLDEAEPEVALEGALAPA